MKSGRKSRCRSLQYETLESRQVMAASIMASLNAAGVLNVVGTDADDQFQFHRTSGYISINGVSGSWSSNAVKSIVVDPKAGNDYVSIDSLANGGSQKLSEIVQVTSGAGDDRVRLLKNKDVYLGGAGHSLTVEPTGAAAKLDGTALNLSAKPVISFNSGVLTVKGTNASDTLSFRQTGGKISIVGVSGSWSASNVTSIVVNLQDGDDHVSLDSLANGGKQLLQENITVNSGVGNKAVRLANGHDVNFSGSGHVLKVAADGTAMLDGQALVFDNPTPNDAPVATNDSYSINEDASQIGNVLSNDTDANGDMLSATLASGPSHGSLTLNSNGSFTYTPAANYNGSDSFTYRASDGSLLSNAATVTVTVNAVNDAPVATNDAYSVSEDTALSGNLLSNDTDVDGDTLSAVLVTGPSHGSLTLNSNGSFTYTPTPNYTGSDSFTYSASDGSLWSNTATVSITVNSVNHAPVATNDAFTTNEETALAGNVLSNDSDLEGSTLTASLVSGPTHGSLTLNSNGSFTYTPAANYNGSDSFTYRAIDGSLSSNTATVSITINPVNDAPVATNDAFSVNQDTALTGNVLSNDTDVDANTLTAVLVSGPSHGLLTLNSNGSFTYTPAANYNGSDSFTYQATDGSLSSNIATVSVTVNSTSTSNWFDTHIQDAALRSLGSTIYQDNLLDRNDILALFTSAEDGGTVDTTEFNDLKAIVSNTTLFGTSNYVWKLSSYVVSGSSANANYQGGALGNLAAGSTDIQLGNLVNKWFLGLDRPATPYGYALASGQLFVDGPSYADIAQGGLNNCGIMASLAEVALKSPSTITNMFIVNGDGTYTVRFFNAGVAEYVTVDSYLPGGGGVYARTPNGELWGALAEKACAQLNEFSWCQFGYYIPTGNSYASIEFTYIYAALGHITGQSTSAFSSMSESTFATAFSQGKSICFASNSGAPNVVSNHAYAVVGYDATTHTVTLFNPWGIGYGLTTLTWSQMQANFSYFDRTV